MSDTHSSTRRSQRGPLFIGLLALLLVGLVLAIVKLIEGAPSAAAVAASQGGGASQGPPPAAVFVAPVEIKSAQDQTIVTGTLRAVSRAEVAAQEPETVAEVLVDDGDRVSQGDTLVRLDERRLKTEIAAAQAQFRTAQKLVNQRRAEQERAATDLEMKKGLMQDKSISRSEFLDAESAFEVVKAQLEAAAQAVAESESRCELLEIRRRDLEIKAPFAGMITARHVEPGEWVSAGQSVMTLVTIDPVEAWMNVPERHLSSLTKHPQGTLVRLSSSGEIFEPTKVIIVPDVEPRSQLFTVVATLSNPNGRLAPGQSITGIVPVGEQAAYCMLPVDALIRTRNGDFVFVADNSSKGPLPVARKVAIRVDFERDALAFVRAGDAGLKEGDRVIVEGNDRLQPNQPLMVEEKGTPSVLPPRL